MKKLLIALSVVGFGTVSAMAQSPKFSDIDANADKMLTLQEMQARKLGWAEEQFNKADRNGDGMLSEEEYHAVTTQ